MTLGPDAPFMRRPSNLTSGRHPERVERLPHLRYTTPKLLLYRGRLRRRHLQAIRTKRERLHLSILPLARQFLAVEKEVQSANVPCLHHDFILCYDQLLSRRDQGSLVRRIPVDGDRNPALIRFLAFLQQYRERSRRPHRRGCQSRRLLHGSSSRREPRPGRLHRRYRMVRCRPGRSWNGLDRSIASRPHGTAAAGSRSLSSCTT